MMDYIEKWNKYEIGNIQFINLHKEHPCRFAFVNFVLSHNIDSILEIGAGELIEGRIIKEKKPSIMYSVMDVSDVFLSYASSLGNFFAFKGNMENIPFKDKQFDIVYLSSVLEHSPDIKKTINDLSKCSSMFYFTLFKWGNRKGGLSSKYNNKKKYYSTYFNIDMLLDLISFYGKINKIFISHKEDYEEEDFIEYRKNNNYDLHRNGNRLNIIGEWN